MAKTQTQTERKFVQVKSPRGDHQYNVPEEMKSFSVSAVIRALHSEGMTNAEIAKKTGILYQHVRNVLSTPLKRKAD